MHRFDVESERYVFYTTCIDIRQLFLQHPETIVVVPMKDRHSDAGPSTTTTYQKESLSPRTDTDPTTGELSSSNWVVDGSGFLSPAGPVLKEVLDLVDGVCICNNWQLQWSRHSSNGMEPTLSEAKISFLIPGHWRLVQSSSVWPAWGQPKPGAPPVPSRRQRIAGAEQRQQRRADPYLTWRGHITFYSSPPKSTTHHLVSRCWCRHLELHDSEEHPCQNFTILSISGS